jgi:hypothetical protein
MTVGLNINNQYKMVTESKCIKKTDGENKEHYDKYVNNVVVDGKKSECFQTITGVRQGSVLSPMLPFNIEMEEIIIRVREG